jgi:hypothetical protein
MLQRRNAIAEPLFLHFFRVFSALAVCAHAVKVLTIKKGLLKRHGWPIARLISYALVGRAIIINPFASVL